MKKKIIALISLLVLVGALASCTPSVIEDSPTDTSAASSESIKIVTTVFPVYDWVRQITGSSEGVTLLSNGGADMHSYDPTASDILTIAQADVFIYIGGESEKWVENALSAAGNSDLTTLALISKVDAVREELAEGMESDEHEEEPAYDEHIWLSLKNAEKAVEEIAALLSTADAANAAKYTAAAQAYIVHLQDLDSDYAQAVETAKRRVILFADRFPFRYLTEDYGIDYYAAFPGCSAESEASFDTVSFLIEKTKELSLPYILTIDGSDRKLASTVQGSAGAKILTLNSCQSVTQKDIDDGLSYYTIMESNLHILREALN